MSVGARTSIRIDIPFRRLVQSLRDDERLVDALIQLDARAQVERVLGFNRDVALMFGDPERFTPLLERLGDSAAAEVVAAYEHIIDRAVRAHAGRCLKSTGDGFMAVFAEPTSALRGARDIQRALSCDDAGTLLPNDLLPRLRLGVHCGAVVPVRAANGAPDVVGRNVVLAARIMDAARGGQTLVSSAVRSIAEPLGEFRFHRERNLSLKGFSGRHRVAELEWCAS